MKHFSLHCESDIWNNFSIKQQSIMPTLMRHDVDDWFQISKNVGFEYLLIEIVFFAFLFNLHLH